VYVVTRTGTLHVFPSSTTSGLRGASPLWSAGAFSANVTVHAHPTLDCNRLGGARTDRPGTLYIVGNGGGTGVLSSIIVDSTKLEPTAPWPKWQRTAGNAGNPAFPLNPGCP